MHCICTASYYTKFVLIERNQNEQIIYSYNYNISRQARPWSTMSTPREPARWLSSRGVSQCWQARPWHLVDYVYPARASPLVELARGIINIRKNNNNRTHRRSSTTVVFFYYYSLFSFIFIRRRSVAVQF